MEQQQQYEIKVGDVITAYHKGYHVVTGTSYEGRCWKYKQVLTADGRPRTAKRERTCDKTYCLPAMTAIQNQLSELACVRARLVEFLAGLTAKPSE